MEKDRLEELLAAMTAYLRAAPDRTDRAELAREIVEDLSVAETPEGPMLRTRYFDHPSRAVSKWPKEHVLATHHLNAVLLEDFRFHGSRVQVEKVRKRRDLFRVAELRPHPLIVVDPESYSWHREYVAKHVPRPKKVYFIQHSGASVLSWIRELIRSGSDVEWYAQERGRGVNEEQRKVLTGILEHKSYFKEADGPGTLRVYESPVPFSVRGVKVDDQLVSVGWYTYHQYRETVTTEEGIDIQGHERPSVVALKGSAGFDELCRMFDLILADLQKFKGEPVMTYPLQR